MTIKKTDYSNIHKMLIDRRQHFFCDLFSLIWLWISEYCEELNEKPPQWSKFHPGGCQLDGCRKLSPRKVLHIVHVQIRFQSVTLHKRTSFIQPLVNP